MQQRFGAKQQNSRKLQILLGSQTAFGEKLQTIGLTGAVIGTKIKIMQLEIRERGRLYLLFCEKDLREGCHSDIFLRFLKLDDDDNDDGDDDDDDDDDVCTWWMSACCHLHIIII